MNYFNDNGYDWSFILAPSVDKHEEAKAPLLFSDAIDGSPQPNQEQNESFRTPNSMLLYHSAEKCFGSKCVCCEVQWPNPSTAGSMNTPFEPLSGHDVLKRNGQTLGIVTNIQNIHAMKEYKDKSPDEVRLEDYNIYNNYFVHNKLSSNTNSDAPEPGVNDIQYI